MHISVLQEANVLLLCQSTSNAGAIRQKTERKNSEENQSSLQSSAKESDKMPGQFRVNKIWTSKYKAKFILERLKERLVYT